MASSARDVIRKPYCTPKIEQVHLMPQEAVLGGCKVAGGGSAGPGDVSGNCYAPEAPCSQDTGS